MEAEAYWAPLPDATFLLALLPQGIESARRRMPRLRWAPLRESERFKEAVAAARAARAAGTAAPDPAARRPRGRR
jgi:hypothetical protein